MLINKIFQKILKIFLHNFYSFWRKAFLENFKHFQKLFSVKAVKVIRYTPWSPPLRERIVQKKNFKKKNQPLLSSQSFENLKFGFWNLMYVSQRKELKKPLPFWFFSSPKMWKWFVKFQVNVSFAIKGHNSKSFSFLLMFGDNVSS